MLASEEIEIVVNLTTPNFHFDVCKQALLAGKHVYVEKPLSLTLENGTELVKLAKKRICSSAARRTPSLEAACKPAPS